MGVSMVLCKPGATVGLAKSTFCVFVDPPILMVEGQQKEHFSLSLHC